MAIEAMRTNHELETLRIERPQEQPRRKRSRLVSIAILMLLQQFLGLQAMSFTPRRLAGRPQCKR